MSLFKIVELVTVLGKAIDNPSPIQTTKTFYFLSLFLINKTKKQRNKQRYLFKISKEKHEHLLFLFLINKIDFVEIF